MSKTTTPNNRNQFREKGGTITMQPILMTPEEQIAAGMPVKEKYTVNDKKPSILQVKR